MTYYGGKDGAGVAQRLINQIPPHRVFISAFLGDCAVLRRIRPAELTIGIDRDRQNIDRWHAAWGGSLSDAINMRLYCTDAIEWLRHALGFYLVASSYSAAGDGVPGSVARSVDLVPANAAGVFIYCDPPYRLESRQDQRPRYRCEMSNADHVKLLETLHFATLETRAQIMVQHYPCDLYAANLSDWRTWTYRAKTRRGMATEQVWCNYPQPTELHDTRFLGRNKRQRESIRRRATRWKARLERMNPLERQAILNELENA